jgi:hypothetical protein
MKKLQFEEVLSRKKEQVIFGKINFYQGIIFCGKWGIKML